MNRRLRTRSAPAVRPHPSTSRALLHRAALTATPARTSMFESLEGRTYFAVTVDGAGNTVVIPEADSRIVYVSSTLGNDANSGLTPEAPVATINAGIGKLRAGMPDQLLLRRGDTFSGSNAFPYWHKSGRSVDQPMVVGAYGAGDKPTVKTTVNNSAFRIDGGIVSNLVLQNINFWASARDPLGGEFVGIATGYHGVHVLGNVTNMLVENCSFKSYRVNLDFENYRGPVSNVTVRRNQILDAYDTQVRAQGIYASGVDGLTIEENLFDHNGWNENITGGGATIFNHSIYYHSDVTDVTVRGNIIANSASHGVNARAGGTIVDNVFFKNPIGVTFGLAGGNVGTVGGVTGEISGNAFIDTRDISGQKRGWGVALGSTKPGANVHVTNNLFAQDTQQTTGAITLSWAQPTNYLDMTGVNDVTIEGNKVYGWYSGIVANSGFINGDTGYKGFRNVVVKDNDLQRTTTRIVDHPHAIDPAQESWSNNRYWAAGSQSSWFRVQGQNVSWATWNATVDTTGQAIAVPYTDPNRTGGTYNASIGGTGTLAGFLTAARQGFLVDRRFDTTSVLNYLRAGFADPDRGQIAPATSPIHATAVVDKFTETSGLTVTLRFDDASRIDTATLDDQDLTLVDPQGASLVGVLNDWNIEADGSLTASYSFDHATSGDAPTGQYILSMPADAVFDVDGNAMPAAQLASTFLDYRAEDVTAPVATVVTSSVPKGGVGSTFITAQVTYTDDRSIDRATIGVGDVSLLGPDGYNTAGELVGYTSNDAGTSRVATYRFAPPTGATWQPEHSGSYTLVLADDAVSDTAGHSTGAGGAPVAVPLDFVPPTTSLSVANVNVSGAGTTFRRFTVTYTDPLGLNLNSFGPADIRVFSPTGTSHTVSVFSNSGTSTTTRAVTYQFNAPGGTFDAADTGVYSISIQKNEVYDANNNPVTGGTIGTFRVDVIRPDMRIYSLAPIGRSVLGEDHYDVVVEYTDNDAIDLNSIKTGNIQVRSNNSPVGVPTLLSIDSAPTDAIQRATFRFTPPGGTWSADDHGTYSFEVGDLPPTDRTGNERSYAGLNTLKVDFIAPVAVEMTANDIVESTDRYAFDVRYGDLGLIDIASADADNIRVIGPDGLDRTVALQGTDGVSHVQYQLDFATPLGARDNGVYTVVVGGSPVRDRAGNAVEPATIGTFTVAIPNPAPTVSLVNVDDVTTVAAPTLLEIKVALNDADGIDVGSIETGALVVIGPDGQPVAATLLTIDASSDPTTATFTFAAPNGRWDASDNGTYTITATDGAFADELGGTSVETLLGTFDVNIAVVAPTATMAPAPTITTISNWPMPFDVTFTDDAGIDVSSIDASDVVIVAPDGQTTSAVGLLSLDSNTDGTPRTATFTIAPPGGMWDYADNGEYTVKLLADSIYDIDGTPIVAVTLGTITVDVPATPPTAQLAGQTNITTASTTPQTLTVTFNDDLGVNASTIGTGDVLVTTTGGTSVAATLVSVTPSGNGTTRVATFSFAAPGGAWDNADNGTYTITLAADSVYDVSGVAAAAATLGSFTVNVPLPGPTTGSIKGTVYNDLNHNGIKETTDPAMSGVRVFVDKDNDGVYDSGEISTTTASNGTYTLANVPAGDVFIAQTKPSGYRLTSDPAAFRFVLGSGQTISGKDFVNTNRNIITGTLFNDANANGTRDTGEQPLSGWTVYTDTDNDAKLDANERKVTTDANGNYTFTALPSGTYRVRQVIQSGYRLVNPSGNLHSVAVSSGAISTGKNFANTRTGILSGTVYNDLNGNGSKASSEKGLGNWVVYIDKDNDNVRDADELFTTTTSNGAYSLAGVPTGASVTLKIVLQSGWRVTNPTASGYTMTLTAAQTLTARNFGVRR